MKRFCSSFCLIFCILSLSAQNDMLSFNMYNTGVSYLKNNNIDSALYCFSKSLAINPELSKFSGIMTIV